MNAAARIATERQDACRRIYRRDGEQAWVTDLAWTESTGEPALDPTRGVVHLGLAGVEQTFSFHSGLGGDGHRPPATELLCAALAADLDGNLRWLAACAGLRIERLVVMAFGDIDMRGALGVGRDIPVGFQSMRLEIEITVDAPESDTRRLIAAAERRSIVLATLRAAVPVELVVAAEVPAACCA